MGQQGKPGHQERRGGASGGGLKRPSGPAKAGSSGEGRVGESLILLPDPTGSKDSSTAKGGRMLAIVTGSSLSWFWGCFFLVF